MRRFFQSDNFIGLVLAALSFLVYLTTVSPSLGYWDSSEIAAVVSTLGITHPTGYPLFTLIGWGFAHLPTGFRAYYNLNLMVAFYCSLSVFFFYRLFVFLLSEKGARLFGFSRLETGSSNRIAAGTAVLVLAFSRTFWSEAVSLEVYSFHLVFLSLVSLLFVKSLAESMARPGRAAELWWMLFALVLGLSFSHHMMTVLLAPAFLTLYFSTQGAGKSAWIKIGRAAIPFLAGLSFYLYLPLRAAQGPVMNWGDPDNLHRFWLHISAAQYRFKMFASADLPIQKSVNFFGSFPAEFGYLPLVFALVGLVWLSLYARKLLVFTLLLVAICLFYAFNYDFDDPNFYLHAYVAAAIWIAFGLRWMLMLASSGAKKWHARAICVVVVLFPFDMNYTAVDESQNFAVEDYVRNILDPLPQNALILSDDLQGLIPSAYYLQLVEGFRPDVVVVGHGVLAYPWYLTQLEKRHPGLLQGVGPEIQAYQQERRRIESGDTTNFRIYSVRFTQLVQGILRTNRDKYPLYVTPDIPAGFFKEFVPVPEGLAIRLVYDTGDSSTPGELSLREFHFRPIPEALSYGGMIRSYYAKGYSNQGVYAILGGDSVAGFRMLQKSRDLNANAGPQGAP